ncbi:MAG: hypothetical protein K5660_09560 [Paludibacteraceae bacterium]|nr:hypothetical protein [Paludibacteraceae bacterium]
MGKFNYFYGSKKGESVKSYEEWEKVFHMHDSKGKVDHWKSGYSAQSLAEDFMCKDGEQMLMQLVEQFTGEHIQGIPTALIEHGSSFDSYGRTRMQDLVVFGKLTNEDTFFIGLEAKVKESFGSNSIKKQYDACKAKIEAGISTNADKRLQSLVGDFLHKELEGLTQKELDLRYQLLFYLAGSFRDPEGGKHIFMPIVAYHHIKGKDKNKEAFEAFIEALGGFTKQIITVNGTEIIGYKKELCAPLKSGKTETKMVYTCYITK